MATVLDLRGLSAPLTPCTHRVATRQGRVRIQCQDQVLSSNWTYAGAKFHQARTDFPPRRRAGESSEVGANVGLKSMQTCSTSHMMELGGAPRPSMDRTVVVFGTTTDELQVCLDPGRHSSSQRLFVKIQQTGPLQTGR